MTLDSSKFSDIGKYGTVYLMKTHNPSEPLTAFPLDDEETTFGRDSACSIRLYYSQVSPIHGKIIIRERKAYLVVLGGAGLFVDGCKVMPNSNTSSHIEPRTVPLTSDTEIQIHTKLFKFAYPPKELRAALLATPAKTPHGKRRALRLSMIQSAQVFTPRPSPDPRENLRILQSPLRPFSSPKKSSPLLTQNTYDDDDDDDDEEIILVDGNHPRVVEDEKDLVILEDVEVTSAPSPPLPPIPAAPVAPPPQINAPPQTPRRVGRPSLHKAVLIRSAQRAVLRAEIEREEAEDEREVEEFATQLLQSGSESSSGEEDNEDGRGLDVEDESGEPAWKKGLQAVQRTLWPFGGDSQPSSADMEEEQEPDDEDIPDSAAHKDEAGPPRNFGRFMTPQPARTAPIAGRFSIGGEARRVVVEPKWKVKDIELPPVKENNEEAPQMAPATPTTNRREKLSDEERKAIQERRRSALKTPDPFFGGRTPGMRGVPGFPTSPSKPSTSPIKSFSPLKAIPEPESDEEDEDLDTRSLLDKMKETVEEMKRRRSLAPPGLNAGSSPRKAEPSQSGDRRFSLLAPAAREEVFGEAEEAGQADGPQDDEMDITDGASDEDEDKENAVASLNAPNTNTTVANAVVMTPKMDGLRHIFAEPKGLATPSFVGVRDLFKTHPPRTVLSPTYEGLGEMMPEPECEEPNVDLADEASTSHLNAEIIDDQMLMEDEDIVEAPAPPMTKPTRISKKSTRANSTIDTPSLADDEATPGAQGPIDTGDKTSDTEEDTPDVRPNLRTSRIKKPVKEVPTAPAKPKRTRSAIPTSEKPAAASVKPPSRSKSRIGKDDESSTSEIPAKKPPSRGKASVPTEEASEPVPARRGRKAATKADKPAVSAPEETRSSLPKPTRKARTVASKTVTKTAEAVSSTDQEESTTTRRKVAPRTRAKTVVKEEETDDGELSKEEPARTTRRVVTKKTTTRTPASQKSTPATSQQRKDKENTPGSGEGDEDSVDKPSKTTKATRTSRATVKAEETKEDAPKRTTRATRTRSKAT